MVFDFLEDSVLVFVTKLENRNVEQEVIYALWFYGFDLQFWYLWEVHTLYLQQVFD